ncbi:MAG: hypothetical protein JXQ73_10615 [Phycisphaerae bacterium]|nr:hypothetical protein [Phycisphaerae bacterium]
MPRRQLHTLALPLIAVACAASSAVADDYTVDFRYAPAWWQTSICLPDDWQKTIVGKEGSLLYDYGGQHDGFKTRISFGLPGPRTDWVMQELRSPRVPIVKTTSRRGPIQIVQEAFAIAPRLGPDIKPVVREIQLERVGNATGLAGWAAPSIPADKAFANIAVGWNEPIHYRFHGKAGERYSVIFGLCEGHHTAGGQRVQHLQVEGKTRHTLDLVSNVGRGKPAVFAFDAADENGDGWIDLSVVAADQAGDKNTVLNAIWVFPASAAPPADKLIAGPCPDTALGYVDCGGKEEAAGPPRHDMVIAHMICDGKTSGVIVPSLLVESEQPIWADAAQRRVRVGSDMTILLREPFEIADQPPGKLLLNLRQVTVSPGKSPSLVMCVARGRDAAEVPIELSQAGAYLGKAERFWKQADLPYGRITVPDTGIQALVDSSIRNIYQAREIKKGLPAFQVGPTCYRGLWVVDGSFLMEAVTFLGRLDEARDGIAYLLGFQRPDGGIMLIDGHLKETGIALWAIARHARLTGDKSWLAEVWPKVERGFAYIRQLRKAASANPSSPNAGLVPDGFSDGGLGGKSAEYTNVYWTLTGMHAAVDAANWLGKTDQANAWRKEYEDFLATYRRAAARDTRKDAHGNAYVPIRMVGADKVAPQKAQWAFLHAVFPGKIFPENDPLVRGNMAMLAAVEREGLVYGTGWLDNGVWNYFGSFYGHAWLWLGDGQKAARTLYAFANHASPLLAWREEQLPVGQGDRICGDMPHNWASAEFIRLVRHLLVLERGDELHLLEGMPAKWARPGCLTKLDGIITEFGPLSLECRVAADGKSATLRVTPPERSRPSRVVLHVSGWSAKSRALDLPPDRPSEKRVAITGSGGP